MDLKFPELRGGTVQGLNDAGVENFQGAIDTYLARECRQNTLDAPRPGVKKVFLKFDKLNLRPEDIPGFSALSTALDSCLERWGDKEKEKEFFEQAILLAKQDEIPVLRISDYGTTGLTGDDADEKGRWFALVKSQGVSNKGDTAGGSFGIGKSSPFAASRFRTVFYGTLTDTGTVALQGVSRMATHKNSDGKLTQGVGFIGMHNPTGGEGGDPLFSAIRKSENIPSVFKRAELGTDIWVIGYRSGPEWRNDLIRSLISNFWPAIHRGSIEFTVGEKIITQGNLQELIVQHIGQEEFEAHHFYKAAQNEPIRKTLKHTGTCELYLTSSSPDLPRKICMVRNSGMRIYDYLPRSCRVPFSGLFICTDTDGNKLLRKLEPPKHDIWDTKRIEGPEGKRALEEIKVWIREEVKKLNPLFSGKSFNEDELGKYIPDQASDEPNDVPQDETGKSDEEDIEPKPKQGNLPITPLKPKSVSATPGGKTGAGSGKGAGGSGPGADEGSKGGGENTKGGGIEEGPAGYMDDFSPPTLKVRSYRAGPKDIYEVVLRSDADYSGAVSIQAIGEDGQSEQMPLHSASLATSPETPLKLTDNLIQGLSLIAGVPLRITVRLDAIERRSLTAVAQK